MELHKHIVAEGDKLVSRVHQEATRFDSSKTSSFSLASRRAMQLRDEVLAEGRQVLIDSGLSAVLDGRSQPQGALAGRKFPSGRQDAHQQRPKSEVPHVQQKIGLGRNKCSHAAKHFEKESARVLDSYKPTVLPKKRGATIKSQGRRPVTPHKASTTAEHHEQKQPPAASKLLARDLFSRAIMFKYGNPSTPAKPGLAVKLFEQAIAQERRVDAMYELGDLLEHGATGVPKDTIRAVRMYEWAVVEGDHAEAKKRLVAKRLRPY